MEAFTHIREQFSPRTPLHFQHEISQEGNAKPLIAVVQEIERRILEQTLYAQTVKSCLANAELSENRKTKVLEDVSRFYAYLKIRFSRPRYKRIPFIPLESEIDILIAGVGQKSAGFLQCIKETAACRADKTKGLWKVICFGA